MRLRGNLNSSETVPLTPPDGPTTSGYRNYGSIVRLIKRTLSSHQHHRQVSYQLSVSTHVSWCVREEATELLSAI